MSVAIITGSCGLVGSAASQYFASLGLDVVGIDNDLRAYLFGGDASTRWMRDELTQHPLYNHHTTDVRDHLAIHRIFQKYGKDILLIVHAAAQPSHDWAAKDPSLDFGVNAIGTSIMLEATRVWAAPDAVFIFLSTNKVYGDTPNLLPLYEHETRFELAPTHPFYENGISEEMSIDDSMHSLFGASKLAADILVQEYRKYFGMRTGVFRCGCITGPNHSGAELHGFLSYMVRCAIDGATYTVFGHKGKQVRDNLHSSDLVSAFAEFFNDPDRDPEDVGTIYNMGGGRYTSCSVGEAIDACQRLTGEEMKVSYGAARRGDHRWWITDTSRFRERYPRWKVRYTVGTILQEIFAENRKRWECRQ